MRRGIHAALVFVVFVIFAAPALHAQAGALRGSVYDSVSQSRLIGALVQVSPLSNPADGRSVATDSGGTFAFDSLPAGSYLIGFLHPMLDSLGIEPPLRKVTVAAGRTIRFDLAIPLQGLRAAVCPTTRADDSLGVLIGILRDARTREAIEGATVSAQWAEYHVTSRGVERSVPRRSAATRKNGWFALCRLPPGGEIALLGSHGADSTGAVDLDLPKSGLARRDLSIGSARAVVVKQAVDSATVIERVRHTGDAVLSGVVAGADGRPIAQAHVGIEGGPEVLTDARGEWRMTDAPPGTRELIVRAIGFYPERRLIDVSTEAPPLKISLSTVQTVLDTVRARAARQNVAGATGFAYRRRTLMGRFIDSTDVDRLHVRETSEIFRRTLGAFVERDTDGIEKIFLRGGSVANSGHCQPAIFLNDVQVLRLDADDIDLLLRPNQIRAIEIYTTGGPPQYQTFNGCGSILMWTKGP